MMDTFSHDIDQAVAKGNPAHRRTMLRRITTLFTSNASRLGDRQVEAFDTVLLKLAQNVETLSRASLSDDLADIPNAPRGVIRELAFDEDVSVAGPVLARSPQIDERDLVRIARERSQDHLYAMSRRRTLSERVTDVLVVRGNTRVLHTVAGNMDAQFSRVGFGLLAEQARADAVLEAMLGSRHDAPHRSRPAQRAAAGQGPAGTPNATISEDGPARTDRDETVPDLVEKQVVASLGGGDVTAALAAVARVANVPQDMALRAFEAPDYDPILFLLRSVRFGWGTLKLFLLARPGKAMTPEEVRGVFEAFQALSVTTARRVVRFTASREQPQAREAR